MPLPLKVLLGAVPLLLLGGVLAAGVLATAEVGPAPRETIVVGRDGPEPATVRLGDRQALDDRGAGRRRADRGDRDDRDDRDDPRPVTPGPVDLDDDGDDDDGADDDGDDGDSGADDGDDD